MKALASALASLMLAAHATAAVPLLTAGPGDVGAPPPNHEPEAFGTRIEYEVVANVRGVAENAVRDKPESVTVSLPVREGPTSFTQYRFEPIEGFTFDERGNVVVDPDVPNERLRYNWHGVSDYADIALVVNEGRSTARLTIDNDVYMLVTLNGTSLLRWLDLSRFPKEMNYPPPREGKAWELPVERAHAKYIDRVKVLVVHTSNAAAEAGGTTAINDLANEAMVDLASTLTNSDIIQTQVELVRPGGAATTLVSYNESPTITNDFQRYYNHRAWVRSNTTVANLRNANEADLVVLLVGDDAIGGVSYIQRPDCTLDPAFGTDAGVPCTGIGPGFAHLGFSVVNVQAAVATLTFPHEVGHNFGLEHNQEDGAAPTTAIASRPWSFGHWVVSMGETPRGARTVMAGNSACTAECPRRPHFSNPNVDFLSFPPLPTGSLTPDPQGRYRFNARTAALFSPIVSEFRGPVTTDRIFRHDFESLPDVGL